jgi:hypothetical protein
MGRNVFDSQCCEVADSHCAVDRQIEHREVFWALLLGLEQGQNSSAPAAIDLGDDFGPIYLGKSQLLQLCRDASESRIECCSERIHGSYDRDRDSGSDQTVFDRRRARLILQKYKDLGHTSCSDRYFVRKKVPPPGKESPIREYRT